MRRRPWENAMSKAYLSQWLCWGSVTQAFVHHCIFQGLVSQLFLLQWKINSWCHITYREKPSKFTWECCSVQLLSHVWLFATPWTAARQASLSITNYWSLLKLMSIELVIPSNYLILCHPLLLMPSVFPSIRVFSNKSVLHIRWPKYWSFSFSIIPSNEHPGLISFRMDWLDLLAVHGFSRVFSNTTVQKHQFFSTQLSL